MVTGPLSMKSKSDVDWGKPSLGWKNKINLPNLESGKILEGRNALANSGTPKSWKKVLYAEAEFEK